MNHPNKTNHIIISQWQPFANEFVRIFFFFLILIGWYTFLVVRAYPTFYCFLIKSKSLAVMAASENTFFSTLSLQGESKNNLKNIGNSYKFYGFF